MEDTLPPLVPYCLLQEQRHGSQAAQGITPCDALGITEPQRCPAPLPKLNGTRLLTKMPLRGRCSCWCILVQLVSHWGWCQRACTACCCCCCVLADLGCCLNDICVHHTKELVAAHSNLISPDESPTVGHVKLPML
jgi:hypothetical protein